MTSSPAHAPTTITDPNVPAMPPMPPQLIRSNATHNGSSEDGAIAFPPVPSGPLERQTATGVESILPVVASGLLFAPPLYDRTMELAVDHNIESVVDALKLARDTESTPCAIYIPFVLLVPRADGIGMTYRIEFGILGRMTSDHVPAIDYGLPMDRVYRYIALSMLRYKFIHLRPFQTLPYMRAFRELTELHVEMIGFIIK